MESNDFELAVKDVANFIVWYFSNLRKRRAFPDVDPGFLHILSPATAPKKPSIWKSVFLDMKEQVLPGEVSPSAVELETIVVDWVAKLLKLPDFFLSESKGPARGTLQNSATECALMSLYSARTKALVKMNEGKTNVQFGAGISKLIAYKSEETHSGFMKACEIALIKYRSIDVDDKRAMRGIYLRKAIQEDKAKGLTPFFMIATLGSTSMCVFDNLVELGPICREEGIWLHIDAAYAGNAFICPEYRYLLNGIEYADSFCFSPHKWLAITLSTTLYWLRDAEVLRKTLSPKSLSESKMEFDDTPDFSYLQVPNARPFTSLKLWFVLRLFGARRLRDKIRCDIKRAQLFKHMIMNDSRFELLGENILSLICFRLKGNNKVNKILQSQVTNSRELFILTSTVGDVIFLRYIVNSYYSKEGDVKRVYQLLSRAADKLIDTKKSCCPFLLIKCK